ncbi:MAG: GIY-YIG nuclease family protein [Ignavibacteria bacterium]|nr:GIY-YIG nuclease family protein [Ignavibacteria bacterium]MBM4176735.1 GIY-YIG nuclease family protein [Ignavibacteria bacterium]
MFYTYIIFSEKLNKYYVGHTDNILRRMDEHNSGKSNFTKLGKPWSLKYTEQFSNRSEAMKREFEIKSRKSKRFIEKLISSAGLERPVSLC